nr:hypothetical protein [Tanacetum cinerariifolium]
MLDKDLYDSWNSRMELYMQHKENGRMILDLVKHGPLIWPTVEENEMTRTKKYAELSAAKKIQANCDIKATNIILQGRLADIYSLVNHHKYQMNHQTSYVPQIAYQSPQVSTQPMTESPLVESSLAILVFSPGDDPIACLNKAMALLTAVASSRFPSTNNQLRTSSNPRNQATIQDCRVTMQQVQGRQRQSYSSTGYKSNATNSGETMQVDKQGLLNATTVKVKDIC